MARRFLLSFRDGVERAGPGIQDHNVRLSNLVLDSGFAGSRSRPGMTR